VKLEHDMPVIEITVGGGQWKMDVICLLLRNNNIWRLVKNRHDMPVTEIIFRGSKWYVNRCLSRLIGVLCIEIRTKKIPKYRLL
jgi:hypothetical protein